MQIDINAITVDTIGDGKNIRATVANKNILTIRLCEIMVESHKIYHIGNGRHPIGSRMLESEMMRQIHRILDNVRRNIPKLHLPARRTEKRQLQNFFHPVNLLLSAYDCQFFAGEKPALNKQEIVQHKFQSRLNHAKAIKLIRQDDDLGHLPRLTAE